MNDALLVSNLILWILVIALALIVFALTRQIGILHERVAPAGALMPTNGPKVGELTEQMAIADIKGGQILVGGEQGDATTMVMFLSPTCPVCKTLVPTARSLADREKLRLVFASDGDTLERHLAYSKDLGLDSYPYVVSQSLGLTYAVSKLPFVVLIGSDGILKSKGLVNTREHLESLVEAMDTGVVTLQDYVQGLDSSLSSPMEERTS